MDWTEQSVIYSRLLFEQQLPGGYTETTQPLAKGSIACGEI